MIVFSKCPYCGLKIGRNTDYCPRCMKHFTSYPQDENFNSITNTTGRGATFLSRNLQRIGETAQKHPANLPFTNTTLQRRFFRLKILFAFVLGIIVFIMLKSSVGKSRLIDFFYFFPISGSH